MRSLRHVPRVVSKPCVCVCDVTKRLAGTRHRSGMRGDYSSPQVCNQTRMSLTQSTLKNILCMLWACGCVWMCVDVCVCVDVWMCVEVRLGRGVWVCVRIPVSGSASETWCQFLPPSKQWILAISTNGWMVSWLVALSEPTRGRKFVLMQSHLTLDAGAKRQRPPHSANGT